MSKSFITKQKILRISLWFNGMWRAFWLEKQVVLTRLYTPMNFLFYRGFLVSLEWNVVLKGYQGRWLWYACTRIQKLWFRSKYAWQNMHGFGFICTNTLITLLFTSLIFNFSDCTFSFPSPWVNLVVSSACGVNTSDSGAPSLVFSHSWTTIVRRRKKYRSQSTVVFLEGDNSRVF